MDPLSVLVDRIRAGRSTVVIGGAPALPEGIEVVTVSCDQPGTRGPLERARSTIEAMLDREARRRTDGDGALLRRRRPLMSREAWHRADVAFVDACNRLAARSPGQVALVFDGVDAADAETHRLLASILRDHGRLRLPLVLVSHAEPKGSFVDVVHALREGSSAPAGEPPAPTAVPWPARAASPARSQSAGSHVSGTGEALPDSVLRTLRAGAVVGSTFDASLVAWLLERPVEDVIEDLQRAHDLGVPIADRRDDHFALPEELAKALVASVLPSLRLRWHARLGEHLAGDGAAARPPPATIVHDPLRAAGQLESAGQTTSALERRLDAVAAMIDAGVVERATDTLDETVTRVGALPATEERRRLEARCRLERARMHWLCAGVGTSLSAEFAEVRAARDMIREDRTTQLRTYIAATLGAIAYDLGERSALEHAERELVETIAALLQDGASLDAAGLLNDQAAVRLRGGDRAGAAALLARSRALFEARVQEVPNDAGARAELADTDHLLARLPLHSSSDALPGDWSSALGHAETAEQTYHSLQMARETAHVWDTMARLEARLGRTDEARVHFEAALAMEDSVGDLRGRAQTTAGLAELYAAGGEPERALDVLRTSIEANRATGSALGLGYDADALATIERAVERMGDTVGASVWDELERMRAGLNGAGSARPSPS